MLDNIAIIGYSGHAYVVIDTAQMCGLDISYYCEKNPIENNPFGLRYLGNERDGSFKWEGNMKYFVGIGDNKIRYRVAEHVLSNHGDFVDIVHPSAVISSLAKSGKGVFISANVTVNALTTIGNQCILNTGCIVEHECVIGNAVHLAPGSVLTGNVSVGDFTFIGANAVVKQGVNIGSNATVGAGAVVIKDIADNEVVAGNPARRIK